MSRRLRQAHEVLLAGATTGEARARMLISRQGWYKHVRRLQDLGLLVRPEPVPPVEQRHERLDLAEHGQRWQLEVTLGRTEAQCRMRWKPHLEDWCEANWTQTLRRRLSERCDVAARADDLEPDQVRQIALALARMLALELVLEDREGKLTDATTDATT